MRPWRRYPVECCICRAMHSSECMHCRASPKFHVSLVWCLGDKTKEISAILPALEMKMLDLIEDVDDFGKVFIKMAHCKSGNRFFDFKLK